MASLFRKGTIIIDSTPVNPTSPMKPGQRGRWKKNKRKLLLVSAEGFMAKNSSDFNVQRQKTSLPYKCDTVHWDMKYN